LILFCPGKSFESLAHLCQQIRLISESGGPGVGRLGSPKAGETLGSGEPDGSCRRVFVVAVLCPLLACVIIECARRADTILGDDTHDVFNDGEHHPLQRLREKATEKWKKYQDLATEIRKLGFQAQVATFVLGMKLTFEEAEWRKQLRQLVPEEKGRERILKSAVRAGARATLQCWEARGGALARHSTSTPGAGAGPRGGVCFVQSKAGEIHAPRILSASADAFVRASLLFITLLCHVGSLS
jgi:hypothetical protein